MIKIVIEIEAQDDYCGKCNYLKGVRTKLVFTTKGYLKKHLGRACRAFKTLQNKPRKLRLSKDNKPIRCTQCKAAEIME